MSRIDAATYHPLNETWSRDAKRVYCVGSEIRGADPKTFQVLNRLYAKDHNRVYTLRGAIPEADAESFVVVGHTEHAFNTFNGYAKDSQRVYHTIEGGKACIIKAADSATFMALGHGYGTDQSRVYLERYPLKGAIPGIWRHLRGPHSHSDEEAYCRNQLIRSANGNHLESLPLVLDGYWSRDNQGNYYHEDQPSDPARYFACFRECFLFTGTVSRVELSRRQSKELLDPLHADSWSMADHGWFYIDCQRWIQKPPIEVREIPQIGQPFRFGMGLHLSLLGSLDWMNEERIWIFPPTPDPSRVPEKLHLTTGNILWWEYGSLDQFDSIMRTIAEAHRL
jgi:hypothetical protein